MENAVLVLNANFEPINVCNIQRALGLMLTDKAALIMCRCRIEHIHIYNTPDQLR